jgi:hypothetical protein
VETDNPAPDPHIRLVTVFETSDVGVVAIAKSVLEEADIDYTVQGESLRNVLGWGSSEVFNAAGGVAAFQVRAEDAGRATALLSRLTSTRS